MRLEFGNPVAPDHLPVGPAGNNLAVDRRAFHAAPHYWYYPAQAMRRGAHHQGGVEQDPQLADKFQPGGLRSVLCLCCHDCCQK